MLTDAPVPATLLGAVLLAAAVLGGYRLVASAPVDRYVSTRTAEAGHLVMNLAMAWMVSPWWAPTARTTLLVVLAATALGFAALVVTASLRRRSATLPAHVFHLVAAGAMIYATVLMPAGHDMDHMGHAEHGGVPALGWVLAGLFALDLLATAVAVLLAPDRMLAVAGTPGGGPDRVRALRVATIPHVVMDAGMVIMLVGTA